MTILDNIANDKRADIALKKTLIPVKQLEQSVLFNRDTYSLSNNLKNSKTGIIAEFKRQSPSKAIINQKLNVQDVTKAYQNAGAIGISILTNAKYFGGCLEDLILARSSCKLPILRKEFIIDEYQIIEAKAYGADAILLIAAMLTKEEVIAFSKLAKSINLDVLLEVHNETELKHNVNSHIDIIGVNNRDLKTFNVSINTSKKLSQLIPEEIVKISESGISSTETIKKLKTYGYNGFLIGEHFMKSNSLETYTNKFIKSIKK